VSGFLAESIQHIHSLRARGVISSHAASAFGSEVRGFRKSGGTLCTTPEAISFLAIASPILPRIKSPVQHQAHSLYTFRPACCSDSSASRTQLARTSVLLCRDVSFIFQLDAPLRAAAVYSSWVKAAANAQPPVELGLFEPAKLCPDSLSRFCDQRCGHDGRIWRFASRPRPKAHPDAAYFTSGCI
jgi:hypothetical protein